MNLAAFMTINIDKKSECVKGVQIESIEIQWVYKEIEIRVTEHGSHGRMVIRVPFKEYGFLFDEIYSTGYKFLNGKQVEIIAKELLK